MDRHPNGLGDDASALARLLGVHGQRFVSLEVLVALDGESELTGDGAGVRQGDVAKLRFSHSEVAEPEGEFVVGVGVEFGEQPAAFGVWGEELDDRSEVERALIVVDGMPLRTAVGEELVATEARALGPTSREASGGE